MNTWLFVTRSGEIRHSQTRSETESNSISEPGSEPHSSTKRPRMQSSEADETNKQENVIVDEVTKAMQRMDAENMPSDESGHFICKCKYNDGVPCSTLFCRDLLMETRL
ncbi:hypothetical protein LSAT2_001164 [Lamellibrachia satsuma]|nr:hypothetical protein LSAT2_001164 [Lamellibrachia satsuma]